jgi:hypothetical protein
VGARVNHDQNGEWYRRDARMNLLMDAVVASLQRIGVATDVPWWATAAIPTIEMVTDVGQLTKVLPALFVKVEEIGANTPFAETHEADVTLKIGCHTMSAQDGDRTIWRLVEDVQTALESDPNLSHLADYYTGGTGVSPPSQMALGGVFQMSVQADASPSGGDAGRGYGEITLKATVLWQQAPVDPTHAITYAMTMDDGSALPVGASITPVESATGILTGGHVSFVFLRPVTHSVFNVLVDGVSIVQEDSSEEHLSYTFTNITGDHTLAVVLTLLA